MDILFTGVSLFDGAFIESDCILQKTICEKTRIFLYDKEIGRWRECKLETVKQIKRR